MPAMQPTTRPRDPESEPQERDPRRRRRALAILAALAALTLGGHLVARRVTAVPATPQSPAPAVALPTTSATTTAGDGAVTVSARLDRTAVLRGGDGTVRVELALAAAERPGAPRVPTDLVVVLDRSGSMGGEKLALALRAIHELTAELAAGDRFALVAYSDAAELAIPLADATPAAREAWRPRVDAVWAGGGTNLASGLDAALALAAPTAGRARRILLLSDGLANQGDASFEGLTGRAAAAARREAAVTAVGVGLDFDERLMGAIADAGTGNFYYLRQGETLAGVFARELEASRATVASALAVVVETADGVELVDAAGYPVERVGGGYLFRPGNLFAGQERRLWLTMRLPTGGEADQPLGRIATSWEDGSEHFQVVLDDLPRVACVASEERFLASLDGETWAASVASDAYARLEERVAGYVRAGRREEAQAEIEAFASENRALNAAVASPLVDAKLEDAAELAAEVDDAFVGADQGMKQKLLSKERQAAAWDGRRSGAKKLPRPDESAAGGGH